MTYNLAPYNFFFFCYWQSNNT